MKRRTRLPRGLHGSPLRCLIRKLVHVSAGRRACTPRSRAEAFSTLSDQAPIRMCRQLILPGPPGGRYCIGRAGGAASASDSTIRTCQATSKLQVQTTLKLQAFAVYFMRSVWKGKAPARRREGVARPEPCGGLPLPNGRVHVPGSWSAFAPRYSPERRFSRSR